MQPSKPLSIGQPHSIDLGFFMHPMVASQYYVMARVSCMSGYDHPSVLLGHQSLELFLKALIKVNNEVPEEEHHLIKLIRSASLLEKNEKDSLLAMESFLNTLSDGYEKYRYSESQTSFHASRFADSLDAAFDILRRAYSRAIKHKNPMKIFVNNDLTKDLVLKNNKLLIETDVSTDLMTRAGFSF